jgi:hypothetical protein
VKVATISEPKIVNTAVMQIWQWARENGHEVEHYRPLLRSTYDRIYASLLFRKTKRHYIPPEAVCGGTGFDLTTRLPPEIEACGYDYSAYPPDAPVWNGEPYSIVWFSRGCIRRCEFCWVREKEGYIQPVEPKNLNPHGQHVKVQDNNFFANPKWREAVEALRGYGQPVEFEGVDVRLLDDEQVDVLKSFRHRRQIKIAWDNPRENLLPKLEWLVDRISPSKIMVYVLIGYPFKHGGKSTHAENLYRVNAIRDLGMDPFVMPYDGGDDYQRHFARWVNGFVYKVASWEEYQSGTKKATA